VNPALVLHIHIHVTWGRYDQAPSSIKPPPFSCFEELSSRPYIPKKVSSYWGKQILIATHVNQGLGFGSGQIWGLSLGTRFGMAGLHKTRPTRRPASQFKTSKTLSKEKT
jgi:hypothetical protein